MLDSLDVVLMQMYGVSGISLIKRRHQRFMIIGVFQSKCMADFVRGHRIEINAYSDIANLFSGHIFWVQTFGLWVISAVQCEKLPHPRCLTATGVASGSCAKKCVQCKCSAKICIYLGHRVPPMARRRQNEHRHRNAGKMRVQEFRLVIKFCTNKQNCISKNNLKK